MVIKIKNKMYQTLTLLVSGAEVKVPAKAELTINSDAVTDQIKNLSENKMITYTVE